MGAFGDVLPDAAKKLYPQPVFSSEEEGIRDFAESAEGFWRTIAASWVGKALGHSDRARV